MILFPKYSIFVTFNTIKSPIPFCIITFEFLTLRYFYINTHISRCVTNYTSNWSLNFVLLYCVDVHTSCVVIYKLQFVIDVSSVMCNWMDEQINQTKPWSEWFHIFIVSVKYILILSSYSHIFILNFTNVVLYYATQSAYPTHLHSSHCNYIWIILEDEFDKLYLIKFCIAIYYTTLVGCPYMFFVICKF
jgi:hypothetical protein